MWLVFFRNADEKCSKRKQLVERKKLVTLKILEIGEETMKSQIKINV